MLDNFLNLDLNVISGSLGKLYMLTDLNEILPQSSFPAWI